MTILQKTSAVLVAAVFCFVCNILHTFAASDHCSCVVSYANYHADADNTGSWLSLAAYKNYPEGTSNCPGGNGKFINTVEFPQGVSYTVAEVLNLYKQRTGMCSLLYNIRVTPHIEHIGIGGPVYHYCAAPLARILYPLTKNGATPLTQGNQGLRDFILNEENCNNFSVVVEGGEVKSVHSELGPIDGIEFDRSGRSLSCNDDAWRLTMQCSGPVAAVVPVTPSTDSVPAYEPIAWSFPTDKINALNKVGISGTGTTQVQLLIGRLIKYAVGFLGALALCLVIYSGLRFMLSEGDEGKQEESLKMMLWAGVGIVALLGSYSMVTFVLGVLRI